ncbi:uncharacterized protein [Triticum aestivum]|uniref:uncharacterized protein n=1 Tax=Triticum aestivum TaxID=4565 RepID=UPI001D02E5B7|nr:uncharacterized protein LOC123185968 [Triticum aestivum]
MEECSYATRSSAAPRKPCAEELPSTHPASTEGPASTAAASHDRLTWRSAAAALSLRLRAQRRRSPFVSVRGGGGGGVHAHSRRMVPRAVLVAGSIPARTRRPPRLGLHGPTTFLLRRRFGLGSTPCRGRCPRRLSPPAVSPSCQCYRRALGTARRNPRATSSHSSSRRHCPPWTMANLVCVSWQMQFSEHGNFQF